MTIKDIVVHVEPGETGERRLAYAVSVARHFEARLTGLAVRLSPGAMAFAGLGEPQVYAAISDACDESCLLAKTVFERVTEGSGLTTNWRVGTGIPADVIAAEAGCADLLILGKASKDDITGPFYDVQPADVILSCGRPVLVVPSRPPEQFRAQRILVAWKSAAAATRAIHDAMPLLCAAQEVILAEIAGTGSDDETDARMMFDHLKAHGVPVTMKTIDQPGDTGELLIAAALQAGCDLIVAGAYGHSRVREWALGGVTLTFLGSDAMPFLLSH